jgi:phage portal protein BeeE
MHLAGSEQKLSNSNVEQLNLSFIVDTLRPILSRIEAEFVRKLMPGSPGVAGVLTVQFDLSERQRGDTAAQVSLVAAGRQWGVMTGNDARRVLSLPAIDAPEENVTMVPVNMQNSKRLLNLTAPVEQVVNDAA